MNTLNLFLILYLSMFSACIGYTNSDQPLPIISLLSYTDMVTSVKFLVEDGFHSQDQFQNDVIFKNGTDYVIANFSTTLAFSCKANFPVMWTLQKTKQVDAIKTCSDMFQTTAWRTSTFENDKHQPTNVQFGARIELWLYLVDFFSVTLKCGPANTSLKPVSPFASVHVFYNGDNNHFLERMGKIIQLPVSPIRDDAMLENDAIIVPCRPSSPNYTVTLEKQQERVDDQGMLVKTWDQSSLPLGLVQFDTKIGFAMKRNVFVGGKTYNVFGLYKCSVVNGSYAQDYPDTKKEELNDVKDDLENNSGDLDDELDDRDNISKVDKCFSDVYSVYINITKTDKLPETFPAFKPILELAGNASVVYNKHQFGKYPPSKKFVSTTELICCSGVTAKETLIFNIIDGNPIQRQIGQPIIAKAVHDPIHPPIEDIYRRENDDSRDCSRIYVNENKLVACIGDNIKFVEHFVNVFNEDLMTVSKRAIQRFQQELAILKPSVQKYEPESFVATVPLSQKMVIIVGHHLLSEELLRNGFQYEPIQSLLLPSKRMGTYNTSTSVLNKDTDDPVSEDNVYEQYGLSDGDKIAEYSRDVYYEGEPLVSVCLGWRNMYAEGSYMRILYENGSKTDVTEDLLTAGDTELYFSGKLQASHADGTVVYQIAREVKVTTEMRAIECWMPQWNTTGWDRITKAVTILKPSLPQFIQGVGNISQGTVYYYLDENGPPKELECQVVTSAPVASINVTKDGIGVMHPLQGLYDPPIEDDGYNSTVKFVKVTAVPNDEARSTSANAVDDGRITLKIGFSKITPDVQGVYQCIAENIAGIVTRTFLVVVQNSRN